mmetsp:Transcript_13575/g.39306  ORF Transcript_13575/g.39306 Transcript_13575/m.39306 type:complete len:563 (-) Transcript_13575:71-1759(-)
MPSYLRRSYPTRWRASNDWALHRAVADHLDLDAARLKPLGVASIAQQCARGVHARAWQLPPVFQNGERRLRQVNGRRRIAGVGPRDAQHHLAVWRRAGPGGVGVLVAARHERHRVPCGRCLLRAGALSRDGARAEHAWELEQQRPPPRMPRERGHRRADGAGEVARGEALHLEAYREVHWRLAARCERTLRAPHDRGVGTRKRHRIRVDRRVPNKLCALRHRWPRSCRRCHLVRLLPVPNAVYCSRRPRCFPAAALRRPQAPQLPHGRDTEHSRLPCRKVSTVALGPCAQREEGLHGAGHRRGRKLPLRQHGAQVARHAVKAGGAGDVASGGRGGCAVLCFHAFHELRLARHVQVVSPCSHSRCHDWLSVQSVRTDDAHDEACGGTHACQAVGVRYIHTRDDLHPAFRAQLLHQRAQPVAAAARDRETETLRVASQHLAEYVAASKAGRAEQHGIVCASGGGRRLRHAAAPASAAPASAASAAAADPESTAAATADAALATAAAGGCAAAAPLQPGQEGLATARGAENHASRKRGRTSVAAAAAAAPLLLVVMRVESVRSSQ